MLGDRRGARAVDPEALARVGRHRDEAFAAARIGDAHHRRGRGGHLVDVLADQIADQHHLRPLVAARLGGVAHRLDVALIQMFQARQLHPFVILDVVLDLDDRRHGILRQPEELETHGADVRRHLVQDEARGGDDAVGAFLLHARQPGEELVGDVLAQAFLAEVGPRDF